MYLPIHYFFQFHYQDLCLVFYKNARVNVFKNSVYMCAKLGKKSTHIFVKSNFLSFFTIMCKLYKFCTRWTNLHYHECHVSQSLKSSIHNNRRLAMLHNNRYRPAIHNVSQNLTFLFPLKLNLYIGAFGSFRSPKVNW